jgi:hypothetical protein
MRSHKGPAPRPSRHSLRLDCQVVRERDFQLVADRIENLSTWGALVGPADAVLTGETVFVSFRLPDGAWIDACGVVTRVLHGRRPGEVTRRLGLEFKGLTEYDRFLLRRAVGHRPLAPPGPRPGRRKPIDLRRLVA